MPKMFQCNKILFILGQEVGTQAGEGRWGHVQKVWNYPADGKHPAGHTQQCGQPELGGGQRLVACWLLHHRDGFLFQVNISSSFVKRSFLTNFKIIRESKVV